MQGNRHFRWFLGVKAHLIIRIILLSLLFLVFLCVSERMTKIDSSLIERIEAVADQLYAEAEREQFPTVDMVRRVARVDMNAASVVMKDWRRKQTTRAELAIEDVPESLQAVFTQTVGQVWLQAQELASESLSAAQAQWEAERKENEALRAELSSAFDALSAELEQMTSQCTTVRQEYDAALLQLQSLASERGALQGQLATAREQLAEKTGEITAYKNELTAYKAIKKGNNV